MSRTHSSQLDDHPSSLVVDASSVYRLLLEEHRSAVKPARAALQRMRKNEGVRDLDGLSKLEGLFSLVRASASYLGMSLLREVAYEAERVIDRLRQPNIKTGPEVVEALGDALTFVEQALRYARTQQREPGHEAGAVRIRERLRAVDLTPNATQDQLSDLELFVEDAQRHLTACRESLVRAADQRSETRDGIDAAFRAMHTLKGNAAMMGFAELEALGRAAEHTLEGLRSGELTLIGTLTLALLNLLEKAAVAVTRPHDFQWMREAQALEVACAEARIVARRTRLGDLLVENNLCSRDQVELVLAIKREPLGEALLLLNALSGADLERALELQRRLRAGEAPEQLVGEGANAGSVQIPRAKLETLARRLARVRLSSDSASPVLREALADLELCVAGLERVSLRGAFRRTALIARELADRQNKQLVVETHGEELEVERPAFEAIADALLHLARNAVDHGLEHPASRVAEGKDQVCRIQLAAWQTAEGVEVVLADDGTGLSRERILERAQQLSLGTRTEAEQLSDEQVFALLFRPGFSTATRLSDVSGRGVGLDVVKHSIEALGGRVTMESVRGAGTRVCLRVPQRAATANQHSVRPEQDPFAGLTLPPREKGTDT